jgi:hypothetical protein
MSASLSCLLVAAWPASVEYGSGVYYELLCLVLLLSGWYMWLLSLRQGHWVLTVASGLCWRPRPSVKRITTSPSKGTETSFSAGKLKGRCRV